MRRQQAISSKSLAQLCALLVLAIVAKTFNMIWIHNMPEVSAYKENAAYSDLPKLLSIPPLRPVRTHFSDPAHYQMTGDNEEWTKLIPGDGTVKLQEPGRKDTQEYTVSLYHQLRCLDIIRQNIVEVEQRRHQNPEFHAITHSTQHCINYLREMVLCRGDIDLETVVGHPKSDVILNQYQCWDWELIYDAVEQNQRSIPKD